jgi:folate-binding protein YgfZ
VPYGPADEDGTATCEIPGVHTEVETEYAALRRGAGLVDAPHRGTLRITGADRRDFLDRMVTQALKTLDDGTAAESFWLSRQGRIDADLLLVEHDDATLVDLDVHAAAATAAALEGFVFTEDVTIADVTAAMHRISIHGPRALDVVAAAAGSGPGLEPMQAGGVVIAGAHVVVARRDQIGGPGLELFVERDASGAVWDALLATEGGVGGGRRRVRPAGWYAYNTARIEGGTPLFNVDFGPTNLPHETGVLHRRVSFTKGCYLGQEIVARMESLGTPKQSLAGLRMDDDRLPVAEGQVFAEEGGTLGDPVGVVTSSTISPMLGARPVAFAMLRSAHAEAGTTVIVNAEGEQGRATVGPLAFWTAGGEA